MDKLHPDLKKRWDALGSDVHRALFDRLMAMSVPFWWHGPTPSDPAIYNNGSLCLLDTGERIIGVTACHVLSAYLARLATGKPFVCQFGGVTVSPEVLLIQMSETLDLATFDLTRIMPALKGYTPHRPSAWPPSRAAVKDLVIYGGFPGYTRRADLIRATFPLHSITGLVSHVTTQNVVIEVDFSRLSDADGPVGNIVSTDPAGTSGGPVYRVTDSPDLEIVGFIYEQSQQHQFVLARHAGVITADGMISPS
jgi:hypothetical protein